MTEQETNLEQQPKYYLAQINIALMKAPLDNPIMAEFADALDKINEVAETSPGFVWRLKTSSGNATNIRAYSEPKMLINISVWRSVQQLKVYVYQSLHRDFFVRRRKWFEKYQEEHFAMWWIPAEHLPTRLVRKQATLDKPMDRGFCVEQWFK